MVLAVDNRELTAANILPIGKMIQILSPDIQIHSST